MTLIAYLLLITAAAASPTPPDLVPRWDHSALGSQTPIDAESAAAGRYATLIALHGMLGVLAFQIIAPAAAIVAAVGKGWSDGLWFRMHWKMQVYVTVPTVILAVVMAAVASSLDERSKVYDKHRITGFVLVGVLILQVALGYYAHSRQRTETNFATSSGLPAPPPKRRAANWLHMGVGIGLLTMGGLQVTWGFNEYRESVGKSVPGWLRVIHWILAGIPPLIITPYILLRGIKRLRAGHSFTDAFFSTPPSSQPYHPPRKLFLGTSTYIDEAYAHSGGGETVFDADADVEKDGVGHEYAKGKGLDGRLQVESNWPGAATREEYEHEVQSSIGHGSVVGGESTYDDYRDRREEEDSLISRAAPIARLPSPGADHDEDDDARPTYPPWTAYDPSPPPPTLPPLPPVSSTFSPPPALPTSVSPPFVGGGNATFSPRLSFMPFAGPDAVHAPAARSIGTSPSPASLSLPLSTTTEAVLRDHPEGEGESARTPTLVPTPPLPPTAEDEDGKGSTRAVESASPAPQLTSDGVVFTVERRPSQVAKVEGEATKQEGGSKMQDEAVVEEEEDEDVVLADDSESTRLMDELERELTISTTRSGRSRAALEDVEEKAGGEADEEPMLEREQSGKWFGSGRATS